MKSISTILLLAFSSVLCYGQNPNITKISDNNYKVRVLPDNFRYERVSHANDNNAQAACLTMLLNNLGLNVIQDDVIRSGFGTAPPNSTQDQQGVTGMNGPTPLSWGRPAHIYSDVVGIDEEMIFSELINNRPLLAGIRSGSTEKPVIVVAMGFSVKYNDKGEKVGISPNTVTIVDPAVGAMSTNTESWSQFVTVATVMYTVKISFN